MEKKKREKKKEHFGKYMEKYEKIERKNYVGLGKGRIFFGF